MLTARQQEIWQFLVDYVDRHGYPPTVREIGEAVGKYAEEVRNRAFPTDEQTYRPKE